jgi:hypothetical protein
MTKEHYDALLAVADAKPGGDGWAELPDHRAVTLHVSTGGSTLSVSRVKALRHAGALVYARTDKGDQYVLALEDVFAGAVDAAKQSGRQAGIR